MRQHTTQQQKLTRHIRLLVATGLCLLTAVGSISGIARADETSQQMQPLLVTEVKLGGNNTAPAEYVTLYNASDVDISLEGWRLEYAKAGTAVTNCGGTWKEGSRSPVVSVNLTGTIAGRTANSIEVAMNNTTAGSVHVIDPTGAVTDLVGWGVGAANAPCTTGNQAAIPADGSSLQRYLNCLDHAPKISNNNAADFTISKLPSPGAMTGTVPSGCGSGQQSTGSQQGDGGSGGQGGGRVPQVTSEPSEPIACTGVIISELLPNPAGADTGHEFIELHNPTDETIPLDGCSLQTSGSTTKSYALNGQSLDPGAYKAYYDTQTGLSLPNASGGTAWLLGPQAEIANVPYATNLEDDQSWVWADGMWQVSFTPTPNAANIVTLLAPCPGGQFRNPDTNRCNTVSDPDTTTATGPTPMAGAAATSSAPTPCPTGQSRNPATNRCRKDAAASASTATSATACKAGQERNPETNRCRNIAGNGSSATAKACPSGQERNPSTNRCRKITASAASTKTKMEDVKDVKAAGSGTVIRWSIALLALIGAALYGLYEWRQELVAFMRKRILRQADEAQAATSRQPYIQTAH